MSGQFLFFTPDNDSKIAGLYNLEYTIGRGHYAVVKLARHVFTGEKVAVKVIDKTKLDGLSQDHLFKEVVCMKLVQHPYVVRLYEVIDTPNKLYLILELGDGGDLYDYIMRHGRGLDEPIAKRYFRQIVTAIAYCHNLHVVHRDLKPENVVFFEKLGLVKLTDFGFSNKFTPGAHLDTACGSLAYSAPEILMGDSYDPPKVDIWSLGVILYMLVCGRLPFDEATDSETLTKILDCDYAIPDHISSSCKCLIQELLTRDPQRRSRLDDVLQADWLKIDYADRSIDLFSIPLVSRECLSFEDHMEILSKMADGQLASVEEIQSILDHNEYNHIAATYFLLAERKLKRKYMEEYKKRLVQWSQHKTEQPYIDPCSSANSDNSVTIQSPIGTNGTSSGSVSSAHSTRVSVPGGVPVVDERVRRFSMILEDAEEEEEQSEEEARFRKPLLHQLIAREGDTYPSLTQIKEDKISVKVEADVVECDKLAEQEEEEELIAVASLAIVRSDWNMDQVGVGNSAPYHPISQGRLGSRLSGSGADVSDGAESDASVVAPHALSRSLPTAEKIHRSFSKHSQRRSVVYSSVHRPLVSVRSSPHLLKHIAEQDEWSVGNKSTDNTSTTPSFNLSEAQNKISNRRLKYSLDSGNRGSFSYRPLSAFPSLGFMDDQLIDSRSRNSSPFASLVYNMSFSSAQSPGRTRRYFGGSSCQAHHLRSVSSWKTARHMSLLAEVRRQSVCSSPSESATGFGSLRRRLKCSSVIYTPNRSADRRCSGPSILSSPLSGLSTMNSFAPVPSRSESSTSISDNIDSSKALTAPCPSNTNRTTITCKKRPAELSYCERGIQTPSAIDQPGAVTPVSQRRHGTKSSFNRSIVSTKPVSWCNSAPLLCELGTQFNPSVTDPSYCSQNPSPPFHVVNNPTMPVKDLLCTPIREEDEPLRSTDTTLSASDIDRRRKSDSSNSRASSAYFSRSALQRATYATLTESERDALDCRSGSPATVLGTSRTDPLLPGDLMSSHLTSSNFSLTSLATSVRESRHMFDIIRGTFELQCYYNRRLTDSTTGTVILSGRASVSASIRSLATASENPPSGCELSKEYPLCSSSQSERTKRLIFPLERGPSPYFGVTRRGPSQIHRTNGPTTPKMHKMTHTPGRFSVPSDATDRLLAPLNSFASVATIDETIEVPVDNMYSNPMECSISCRDRGNGSIETPSGGPNNISDRLVSKKVTRMRNLLPLTMCCRRQLSIKQSCPYTTDNIPRLALKCKPHLSCASLVSQATIRNDSSFEPKTDDLSAEEVPRNGLEPSTDSCPQKMLNSLNDQSLGSRSSIIQKSVVRLACCSIS